MTTSFAMPSSPELQRSLELLQLELEETNREVMALTLDLDLRVQLRTHALEAAQQELKKSNSELLGLKLQLEERVAKRTSELIDANRALAATNEKFRTLVEQSIVGIYVIQDDRFTYVNPKMTEI